MTQAAGEGRIGYLLSRYPSANHTYLVREVVELRRLGLALDVVAIDADERPEDALTAQERTERAATFVVKRQSPLAIAGAHLHTLVTRPAGYLRGLASAVRLARLDLPRLLYQLFYFAEAVVAGRHFEARGCRHVHTHYATNVALLMARVFPIEISASIHGSAEFIDPVSQRLREKIAASRFVRAISAYGQSQLMLASPPEHWDRILVARLGVDPDVFEPAPFRPAPAPFRLISVGQLQPAKGFPVLLAALAALVAEGRDVALTLVGGGPSREALEAEAVRLGVRDRVTFTGARNQDEVRDALRDSDAFVLASFAEGIPVVLMEAMATALPCVATRITGIPELIEHGRDGLLVTPADPVALAGAVAQLLDDPGLRARMGESARARIRAEYDLRANTTRYARALAERVAGVARPALAAGAPQELAVR